MAKKTVEETAATNDVEETSELETVEETAANGLIVASTIKCDGIRYHDGDAFPIDHPEAERLFNLGVIKEG